MHSCVVKKFYGNKSWGTHWPAKSTEAHLYNNIITILAIVVYKSYNTTVINLELLNIDQFYLILVCLVLQVFSTTDNRERICCSDPIP